MNLVEYLAATRADGMTLSRISHRTEIAYSTLWHHKQAVLKGEPIGLTLATAERLAKFDPRMTVAEILGIAPPPAQPVKQRRAAGAR